MTLQTGRWQMRTAVTVMIGVLVVTVGLCLIGWRARPEGKVGP